MKEHAEILAEQELPVPLPEPHPTVAVRDAGAISPATPECPQIT